MKLCAFVWKRSTSWMKKKTFRFPLLLEYFPVLVVYFGNVINRYFTKTPPNLSQFRNIIQNSWVWSFAYEQFQNYSVERIIKLQTILVFRLIVISQIAHISITYKNVNHSLCVSCHCLHEFGPNIERAENVNSHTFAISAKMQRKLFYKYIRNNHHRPLGTLTQHKTHWTKQTVNGMTTTESNNQCRWHFNLCLKQQQQQQNTTIKWKEANTNQRWATEHIHNILDILNGCAFKTTHYIFDYFTISLDWIGFVHSVFALTALLSFLFFFWQRKCCKRAFSSLEVVKLTKHPFRFQSTFVLRFILFDCHKHMYKWQCNHLNFHIFNISHAYFMFYTHRFLYLNCMWTCSLDYGLVNVLNKSAWGSCNKRQFNICFFLFFKHFGSIRYRIRCCCCCIHRHRSRCFRSCVWVLSIILLPKQ